MLKIVVMISGGGTNLQAVIDGIRSGRVADTKIIGVISNNKKTYALTRARENHIPAVCISPRDYENRNLFNDAMLKAVKDFNPDMVVLAGFLVILPEQLIKEYRDRIINIHPSLIPSFCGTGYYGLKVHEAVLERGVKVTGATVHYVDEGTDTGPIILQKAVNVLEDDTAEVLQKRVMEEAEWEILPKAIDMIANGRIKLENNKVKLIDNLLCKRKE